MQSDFDEYADGKALYGDNFSPEEIELWFRDEQEGYSRLPEEHRPGLYAYHALNCRHCFRHLPSSWFERVLDVGGAYGDELLPVLDRVRNVTILEPSGAFSNPRFEYVKPAPVGECRLQIALST